MGALTVLRVARRIRGLNNAAELPHLETLIEQESVKIKDGFHYSRWIAPLSGLVLALGCFLPLALTVHPLFWIGAAGFVLLGGVLGAIFHVLAMRISPTQMLLRQRSMMLGQRLVSFRNLLGMLPTLSPTVAAHLEEAAAVYLRARPQHERDLVLRAEGPWGEAQVRAQKAMDEAMVQMLSLCEPETPQAQEVELARGWAQPLLQEMKATCHALEQHAMQTRMAASAESPVAPIAGLMDARADLERLQVAVEELETDTVRERA